MNNLWALISAVELKAFFNAANGHLNTKYRILELAMAAEGKNDYDRGHILDASFFDLTKGVESTKLYPKN